MAVWAGFAGGAIIAIVPNSAVYVWWERRVDYPLLDPRDFLIPRFGLGALTITIAFMAMFGMFFLMTLYMQFVLGWSPLGTAVRLLPFSVVMIIIAPRNPKLTDRLGTGRTVAIGVLIQSLGFLIAAVGLSEDSSY
ncbi:MAG: MFS transporter [Actinobacteria bacterium]|nr:MFS transporter [Actinomycetota bacterium]